MRGLLGFLRRIAITLVVLEVAYVILGNVFITFFLRGEVNADPNTHMEYASAYTTWPGVVTVRDFRLVNQDSSIQWMIAVKEAKLTVDFFALAKRKFHATRIRAEGVTFHLREQLTTARADDPRSGAAPPIPGFRDPPVLKVGVPPPPLTDADYNLWTAQLDDVEAGVEEVWVTAYRAVGPGRVRGTFFFKPLRKLAIGPLDVDLSSVDVRVAEHVVVHNLRGRANVLLDVYDPRDDNLLMARLASIRLDVKGQVPDLGAVNFLRGKGATPRFEDGSGLVDVNANIVGGVVLARSRLRYQTDRAAVIADALEADVGGRLEVRSVASEIGGPRLEIDIAVKRAALSRPHGARAAPIVAQGDVALRGLPADLLALHAPTARVDAGLEVPDLRWFESPPSAEPSRPISFQGGTAKATVHADLNEEGRGDGSVRAQILDLLARADAARGTVRGDVDVEARFEDVRASTSSGRLRDASIALRSARVEREGVATMASMRLDVPMLDVTRGALAAFSADLDARVGDAAALFGAPKRGGAIRPIEGAAHATVHLERSAAEAKAHGKVHLALKNAVAAIEGARLKADVALDATIEEAQVDPKILHVRAGKIAITRAGVGTAPRDWWANIDVPAFDVLAPSGVAFHGVASARCLDGSVPIAVLEAAHVGPKWALGLVAFNDLRANADVRSDRFGLRATFRAVSEDASVGGVVTQREGKRVDADVLVKSGFVSVGVNVRAGKPSVHVLAGQGWLDHRMAELGFQPVSTP